MWRYSLDKRLVASAGPGAQGDDVYGGTVNVASRIAELPAPNEILVSDTARLFAVDRKAHG